jgi:protein phosphatase
MSYAAEARPAPMLSGTPLGEHFAVEALVRLCEGRMIYVLNDDRPDLPTRHCWDCGSDDTPRGDVICVGCETNLPDSQKFMLSVRWGAWNFEKQLEFYSRDLEHPGILWPDSVFVENDYLHTVVRYRNESLMVDQGAPFSVERVLHLSQRFAGLTAYLHRSGVTLDTLERHHFVYRKGEDTFLLFDPDVAEILDHPVPTNQRGWEVRRLAAILRRYTPVNNNPLADFLLEAERGAHKSPLEFGRAVERLFTEASRAAAPPGMAAMTDVGLSRTLNEDSWGWVQLGENASLVVVADGMGGHEAGEVASNLAVEIICSDARERFSENGNLDANALEEMLRNAFQEANNTVKGLAEERHNDMGTTMVAALVAGETGIIANVGDSRAYRMRNQALEQISKDHSLVARMVEQNRLSPEEARTHPHSNILLRTVGTERNVEIDTFKIELEPGDRLLLCSDGLWGEVEDTDIESILQHYEDSRTAARELVRASHHGGGKDNVTILLVGVEEESTTILT